MWLLLAWAILLHPLGHTPCPPAGDFALREVGDGVSCIQPCSCQLAPLQRGLGRTVTCLSPMKDMPCHAMPCHQSSLIPRKIWWHRALWGGTACPVPLHPCSDAGELWVPLAWLEIHPSCGSGSGTQGLQIGSNRSHHQKVPGEGGNMLLNGQKLVEVELSPGYCTGSPVGEWPHVGMGVRCCCVGHPPPRLRRQQAGDFAL